MNVRTIYTVVILFIFFCAQDVVSDEASTPLKLEVADIYYENEELTAVCETENLLENITNKDYEILFVLNNKLVQSETSNVYKRNMSVADDYSTIYCELRMKNSEMSYTSEIKNIRVYYAPREYKSSENQTKTDCTWNEGLEESCKFYVYSNPESVLIDLFKDSSDLDPLDVYYPSISFHQRETGEQILIVYTRNTILQYAGSYHAIIQSTDEKLKPQTLNLHFEIKVNEHVDYGYSDGYDDGWSFPIYGYVICSIVTFFTIVAIIIKICIWCGVLTCTGGTICCITCKKKTENEAVEIRDEVLSEMSTESEDQLKSEKVNVAYSKTTDIC